MGKVIGVINQKGGVGKTTATIELANSFALEGSKVLVIDLDSQCNLSKYVGADRSRSTIYEILHADASVNDSIQTCGNIDVIAASKSLSNADKEFVEHDDIFLLEDVMEMIKPSYDFIFIDNGPARSTLLTMSYVAADFIVIPTDASDGALDGVDEVMNDILKYRQGKRPITNAKISMFILNTYKNRIIYQNTRDELEQKSESFADHPLVVTIRDAISAVESQSFSQSIFNYDPKGNVAHDFRIAAKKLIDLVEE